MRASICLPFLTAMLAGFTPGLSAQTVVRHDGVYQSQEERDSGGDPAWTYLRFTPDGMVISFATSAARADELGSFSLSNPMLPISSVTTGERGISFTVSDCGGVLVGYEGRAEGDRLYLRVHANNGYQAERVFTFVPIAEDRLRQWDASGGVHDPCRSFDSPGR